MNKTFIKAPNGRDSRIWYFLSHDHLVYARTWRVSILCFGLLALFLSGCKPTQQTETSSTPIPTRTAVSLGPTSTPKATSTSAPASQPTPTLAALAALSDRDWSRGPDDAEVTLVVYSDFQ